MKFNSIKFEISILYTAILGLILIAFSLVLFLISHAFLQHVDQQLKTKAQAIDVNINEYLGALSGDANAWTKAVQKTLSMKQDNFLQYKTRKHSEHWATQSHALNLDKDFINIFTLQTRQDYSTGNVDQNLRALFLESMTMPPSDKPTFRTISDRDRNIRLINYLFIDQKKSEAIIQVGVPQDPFMQQMRNQLYAIAISVPLILFLTNFVGKVLADRILQPVYEITNLARSITQQDLSARIKTKHFDREMASLIESFNDMIARLEKSFKHIEQFSYHVAHELKTPLTIIQGEADLLLRRDRPVHEYKQALRIVLEESQRVLKTIDDLLLLTKLDYQQEVFKFEPFDFIEFFNEIVEQNRLLAANKGIGIRMNLQYVQQPLMIMGDRLHLRRLFFNIIDNAIKYTPAGGCVDMSVEVQDGKIMSIISDTGPGIAPEELGEIFKKFYSTGKNSSGSGLGLSISHTIAKLHQGDIQVESQPGQGAVFKVILPLEK